jgi:Bacterial SH3 domain
MRGEAAVIFVRSAAAAAVVTILSVVWAQAKPIATSGETNLRKGPGTDTDILTLVPKGTTVEVGDCSNGWCKVSWNGQDGYVIARNLGMGPAPAPPGGPTAPPGYPTAPPGYHYGPPMAYAPGPYVVGPRVIYPYPYRPFYRPYWGWRRWWW